MDFEIKKESDKIKLEKRKLTKKQKIIIASSIVAALLLAVLIRPAIIGYSIYDDFKSSGLPIKDFSAKVPELNQRLLVCSDESNKTKAELEKAANEANSVKQALVAEKIDKTEKINALSSELNKTMEEKDIVEKNLDDYKNRYDTLQKNSAYNICCKNKIDNPEINFYKVENGKIICTVDSGTDLKCW